MTEHFVEMEQYSTTDYVIPYLIGNMVKTKKRQRKDNRC